MADIYIPGVRSRFNTDQIIEDLMSLERIPRDRVASNIEDLQAQKGYWQEVGRRINSLRDSSRYLFSFQNPFNDRIASSANDSVITASATREAGEQSYSFTVKQTAQADRFLSQPLDERMRVEAGSYNFSVGNEEISINFRGGTLQEFVNTINSRSNGKVSASLLAVQSGTKSLLLESKVTGAENRLTFSGDTVDLLTSIGMMERAPDSSAMNIGINQNTVRSNTQNPQNVRINGGALEVSPLSSASIALPMSLGPDSPVLLKLDTLTRTGSDVIAIPQPPPGPSVPGSSVTYNGITIENEPSAAPFPEYRAPEVPQRYDDMAVLSLVFSDGTSAKLQPITDSNNYTTRTYLLSDIAQGRTIVSLNIDNSNTHREVSVANIEILDPAAAAGGLAAVNPVSTARDAVITMEGIEIKRPTNSIDDLIPGVTINVRGVSDRPVELNITNDKEGIKEAIISFVGNYNLLMAEINVLTARRLSSGLTTSVDDSILNELTYLSTEERAEMRTRLGAFNNDSTLLNIRNNMMRTVSAPYPTDLERELSLLAQIGISTNAERSTGYNISNLRGYLQIDEKVLDAALDNKVPAIKQLFASDTTGDLINDTGVAFNIDALISPYVGTGGIISLKTGTIDSRITQDERRIDTLDRQLAAKETELRIQYARMEAAYDRMEQMSNSLDNFNQQNQYNNR